MSDAKPSHRGQGNRIVWLVRGLTGTGLLVAFITVAIVGSKLSKMRGEIARVTSQQRQLNWASDQLRRVAIGGRSQIMASLDDTADATNEPLDVGVQVDFIRDQFGDDTDPEVLGPLNSAGQQLLRLNDVSRRAIDWHAQYALISADVHNGTTLAGARSMVAHLREAVAELEGQRRLAEAIQYRRWRHASGPEAAREAQDLLIAEAARQTKGSLLDFEHQLAELSRLVEVLGGEEKYDALSDLKDNQFKPIFELMSRSLTAYSSDPTAASILTPQAIENLKIAIFGKGYSSDNSHQTILVGRGGLFALRRDVLQRRRERESLKTELANVFPDIEAADSGFAQSTQARTVALTDQMEEGLRQTWREMFGFVGGGSLLFIWFSWAIVRGIQGQVNAIEQARADAEEGRRFTQQLMKEQQAATVDLAAAHHNLQASEQRFRTLSSSAPIGIFETDAAGNIVYANSHWEQTIRSVHAKSLGNDWQRVLHPDDAIEVCEQWEKATGRQAAEFQGDFRFLGLDGKVLWVSIRTTVIRSEAGAVLGHVGTVQDITQRKQAEEELGKVNKQLVESSRQAGMAEVATGVLHNVGNVLNSVNVAANVIADRISNSSAKNLAKATALIETHRQDLGTFLSADEKGKRIPEYLAMVSEALGKENEAILGELSNLAHGIEHIKQIVHVQQDYAKTSTFLQEVDPAKLIEDALRINMISLERHGVHIERRTADLGVIRLDRHKTLQILTNLISNAKNALKKIDDAEKRTIIVGLGPAEVDGRRFVRFWVEDNGVGISQENMPRMFTHGFTTSAEGHGFGLHASINAAREMGGTLTVVSEGTGHGARFTLELPMVEEPAVEGREVTSS